MTNKKLNFEFLAINKEWLGKGLNPTEILILSQVAEYERNTGDCFISDKAMSELFGVSESTISRAVKALEDKGFLKRETKNVRGGKERHIHLTNSKMTVDSDEQASNCLLTNVNLTIDNKQNDLIKENNKRKDLKENLCEEAFAPNVAKSSSLGTPGEPKKSWVDIAVQYVGA